MRQDVFTSSACTRGIRVNVEARFADERLLPEHSWLFQYDIKIANESEDVVQLLSRHWIIEHGEGRVEEVRGPGVVGAQPYLEPGGSFQYSSWCPLAAPFGSMHGSYLMETASGERFRARIAPFSLSRPITIH